MNKIPCASQNTEAKTLPADVGVFGHFGRLSLAAVHLVDCWFDSGVKWWIHVLFTYSCKISFLLHWKSCKQHSESLIRFWLQTQHPLWTQLSHWQMFMQNGEYTAFWYLQLLCYFTQLQFTIGQNRFVEFFGVFRDNCQIWRPEHSASFVSVWLHLKSAYPLLTIVSNRAESE